MHFRAVEPAKVLFEVAIKLYMYCKYVRAGLKMDFWYKSRLILPVGLSPYLGPYLLFSKGKVPQITLMT